MTHDTAMEPMTEDEIRAGAVREAQAYIARVSRKGLVPLDRVLGDLAAVAQRMENGMTARGSTRTQPTDPSLGVTREDGTR